MNARLIKVDGKITDPIAIADWLEANEYKYALLPAGNMNDIVERICYIEVYAAEVEVALRLKWLTE